MVITNHAEYDHVISYKRSGAEALVTARVNVLIASLHARCHLQMLQGAHLSQHVH